jgi:hypothetical protein
VARLARLLGGLVFRWRRGKPAHTVHRPLAGAHAAGKASDEIMHVTDSFTTILHAAGVSEPSDRVIDGVDQLDWLCGEQDASARDGYIFWMGPEVYGVKWRNFKLALVEQKYSTDPVGKLPARGSSTWSLTPKSANRSPCLTSTPGRWRISTGSSANSKAAPSANQTIPAGAPLPFVPSAIETSLPRSRRLNLSDSPPMSLWV